MKPRPVSQIINRKRYDTETATLLSGDDWFDGHNWERSGRNTFLYKTQKGAYFAAHQTGGRADIDQIEALTEGEAIEMFEKHAAHGKNRVEFGVAFPGIEITDA